MNFAKPFPRPTKYAPSVVNRLWTIRPAGLSGMVSLMRLRSGTISTPIVKGVDFFPTNDTIYSDGSGIEVLDKSRVTLEAC